MSLEQFLENLTLEEIEELRKLKLEKQKSYNFSNITFTDIYKLFDISEELRDLHIFKSWFEKDIKIKSEDLIFLKELLDREIIFINRYKEEDLKVNFISQILYRVNFKILDKKIRDFYDEKLTYKTDKFSINGECDFVVAYGLEVSQTPYFFIQEFKKSVSNSDPRPQLLAELICAVELNNFKSIKGAYIIGAIWNFVILERIEKHKYTYYISQNFDSTKIEDLKGIYKNLLYVKDEIIKSTKSENVK